MTSESHLQHDSALVKVTVARPTLLVVVVSVLSLLEIHSFCTGALKWTAKEMRLVRMLRSTD